MTERYKHEIIYLGVRVGKNDAKLHAFKVVKPSIEGKKVEFYYKNRGKMTFTLFGLYTIESPEKDFNSYFEKSLSGFIGSAKSQLSKGEAQEAFDQHITANGYFELLTNNKAMRTKAKEYSSNNFGEFTMSELHAIYDRNTPAGQRHLRNVILQYLETGKA